MANKAGFRLSNDDWHSLVGRIYDAASNPSTWGDVLLDIGKPVNAHATQLVSVVKNDTQAPDSLFETLDDVYQGVDKDQAIREFEEIVSRGQHVRVNYVASVPEMSMCYDYRHTTEQQMKSDICYQEHLTPLRVPYYVAVPLISSPDRLTAVGHFRNKRYGHFSGSEIEYFARFAPHLRRSLELSRRLTREGFIRGINALLTALNCPAAIVDKNLRVIANNDALLNICRQNDGVSILQDTLQLSDLSSRAVLRRELTHALNPLELPGARGAEGISANRESGRKSYQLFILPLRRRTTLRNRRLCLLLVVDPEGCRHVPPGLLRDAFGLTAAEAEVSSLLALGYDVSEIALRRQSTKETVRSQIKSALRKSGTRRQAEFVAAICRLCPSPLDM